MNDRPSQDEPSKPSAEKRAPGEEEPLGLSDSSDGSTQPVPKGTRSSSDAPSASAESAAGRSRSSSAASSTTSGEGGTTTGGFETLIGKLVVHTGLATRDEVDLCAAMLPGPGETGEAKTLVDVLVDKHYVTRHQIGRLRQDFEAKKSGQHIPGYKIARKLGSGAMATVFLARQLSLDRLVAIKILPKKFSGNEKFIERFYKEGKSAAQLNHPNIVGAYDVGRAGEHHYFVMEYVDGTTIHDRILKHQRMQEDDAIEIVTQVARALQHAHDRGLVHRDIKPKNIMITKSGRVKLADLGLARAMSDLEAAKAEAGRAYGTPYYISPEQIRGELNIGPAADIYGLGATFYHMVTGRVPFEGKSPSAVMHKHLKSPLQPPDHLNPDLSAGCAQVIEMMMAKKAKERYLSAADLIEDLELIKEGQPPHFAHRSLDHETISETLTDVAEVPGTMQQHATQSASAATSSPVFMVILVLLILSVLVNVLLVTLLAS